MGGLGDALVGIDGMEILIVLSPAAGSKTPVRSARLSN
jgi:hypothetical protein